MTLTHEEIHKLREKGAIHPILKKLDIKESEVLFRDKPDVYIENFNGKNIGVEIVECMPSLILKGWQYGERKLFDIKWSICQGYKKWLIENNRVGFIVWIFFKRDFENIIAGKTKDKIVQEVVDELKVFAIDKIDKREYFSCISSKYLHHLEVQRYHRAYNEIVPLGDAQIIEPITEYLINETLKQKEDKVEQYYKHCPEMEECWLCINLPLMEFYDFEGFEYKISNSNYDRIYLTQSENLLQLK
ncbi:MAG: hypothetical protein IKK23_09295 [Bacteroidales bacterium]|nr:hypothetical protein [Bacteroidales bacterium]